MLNKPVVWTLVVVLLVAGCNPQFYDLVLEHSRGDGPNTTRVEYSGRYELCVMPDTTTQEGENSTPPEFTQSLPDLSLSDGDEIGFKRGENGKIIAVAGSERFPLDDGHYGWYDRELHGVKLILLDTGVAVGWVVVPPLVIASAAIIVPAALVVIGTEKLFFTPASAGTNNDSGPAHEQGEGSEGRPAQSHP